MQRCWPLEPEGFLTVPSEAEIRTTLNSETFATQSRKSESLMAERVYPRTAHCSHPEGCNVRP